MTCWRGVSHATPGKSQANPSRHSNAARIALELELAELELLKFIVTPSHSKLSTVPTPRHSNAARIARRSDWRNWASPRCHATPRHRARPSESLQPGLPPAVDVSTSEKTELEIKVKLRNPKSNSKITHHCNSGLPPIVDVSTTEEKWQGSNCVTRARISNKRATAAPTTAYYELPPDGHQRS